MSSDDNDFISEKGSNAQLLRSGVMNPGGNVTGRESRQWMESKRCVAESMDFEEMESVMWRKVSGYYIHRVFAVCDVNLFLRDSIN
jgi:hypothetical protein